MDPAPIGSYLNRDSIKLRHLSRQYLDGRLGEKSDPS